MNLQGLSSPVQCRGKPSLPPVSRRLQAYMPDHNVRPSWVDEGIDIVKEAEEKGLPAPPGRPYKW